MSSNGSGRRTLYRDPSRAKISGVCAGISDYFDLEVWVVRIIAVSALLLFQFFPVIFAYVVLHFIMEPKPGARRRRYGRKDYRNNIHANSDDQTEPKSKSVTGEHATVQQVWKKGRIPSQTIRKVSQRLKKIDRRLQDMESYVTSRQFQLRKEFNDLN